MRGAPRTLKVGIRRVFGERGYESAQTWYWKIRTRILSYDFSFRDDLEQLVRPGDTVVDVGANVGQYAMLFAKLVGPAGRVVAFEPAPGTYRMLTSITPSNVEPVNMAVADFDGTGRLTQPRRDGLPDIGRAHLTADDGPATVNVAVARLDTVADRLGISGCALVKVDVEGAELAVLNGAQRFLDTYRPAVLVDACPETVARLLARMGYSVSRRDGSVILFTPPRTSD